MAKETKTQLWITVQKQVSDLLESSKAKEAFKSELLALLEANLAPKAGGGLSLNPSRINDLGETEHYCRFHQCYEVEANMVMSSGKSKGYCKASISVWNKANSDIKKLDSKAVEAMSTGDFESAQEIAKESKALREAFNLPSFYNFDRDWAIFNS